MAEPLKNNFGPDIPERIARFLYEVDPAFDQKRFLALALEGYGELELTARAKHIAAAMADTLPADRGQALDLVTASLGPEITEDGLTGFDGFFYFPHVYFVADVGLDHFEESMRAQYELTKRFSAEFSIRTFLIHHQDETLTRLHAWTDDPNVHVRRLVSEGTRPRLPWAPQLKAFQEDPTPVIRLLEKLKNDAEEYVRRSVANNLNDIAKDNPSVVTNLAQRWWNEECDDPINRKRMVRHGLRTLIKRGDADALAVLGFGADSPATVTRVMINPGAPAIGESVRIEVELHNPSSQTTGALVDLKVHFVKASGTTSPKVFKGAEIVLEPGESATVKKTISLAQHSTRTHYPGEHTVEVVLNGVDHRGGMFELS